MTSIAPSTSGSPAPVRCPPAWAFWCGLGLISGWIALIGCLTWTSSNPITLNRRQIFDSDLVVVGRVTQEQGNKLITPVPDQPWPLPDQTPIQVTNLDETRARVGQSYLFPLRRVSSRNPAANQKLFEVTPSALPNAEPLVYPAGSEAFSQLKEIQQEPRPSVLRRKSVRP